MTEAQAQVGSDAGPLDWLAAVLTSLSVVAVLFFGLVYGAEMSWPWGVALPVLGIALTFLSVACTITAAVDCWLALGRPRRRLAHDYLRTAWILLVVAAFAGGLPVAPWLLPALVMTWAAAQRAKARTAAL
jgi:hypothetical protein